MKQSLFVIAIALGGITPSTAQDLELSSTSGPTGSGPVVAPSVSTFRLNTGTSTTFSSFTPATTVQIAFSNQQHTTDSFPGLVAGGTSTGANATTPAPTAVHQVMSSLGSPSSAQYTSAPFGTPGTGFSVADNYGFRLYSDVSYLVGQPLNGRYYYGNLTITFPRPVVNPVLHLAGIGAQTYTGAIGSNNLGFYTEFDLSTTNVSAGYSLTKLSGTTYFNVTSTSILNSSITPTTVLAGSYYTNQSAGNSGSGGSVRVNTGGIPITSITLQVYVRGDGGVGSANAWMGTTRAGDAYQLSASLSTYTVSGNVYNDVNGLSNNTINGVATGLPSSLYANLVDANGNLYASTAVSGGVYSFSNVVASTYKVVLTTSASSTVPALPSGWVQVGENLGTGAGTDGTADGMLSIAVGTSSSQASVANANFGIQRPPTAGSGVMNGVVNLNGSVQHTVLATAFSSTAASSDPSPGAVTSIRITALPTGASSIVINGTSYTPVSFPVAGVIVPANASGQPTQTITVDPTGINITSVTIPFNAIDAGGFESADAGSAVINFVELTISGKVRNDQNGNTINGPGIGVASGTQLYMNLVHPTTGLVLAVDTIPANGQYIFGYDKAITANSTYKLVLSTTKGVVGTTTGTIASIPPGWVNLGEGDAGTLGDGLVNGILSVPVGVAVVVDKDFGIERAPFTDSKSVTVNTPAVNQYLTLNGATGNPPVMTGSDPEDQPVSAALTGKKVAITSLPTKGKLWYNGTQVTVGQDAINPPSLTNPLIITALDPSVLQFQATGSNYYTTTFSYAYIDEADIIDPTPASYTIDWSTPLPVVLSSIDVRASDCNAIVNWESSSEASLSSYELQSSKTGQNDFVTIATVAPKGNGSRYEVSHLQNTNEGYYRLKMNGMSGGADYSAIRVVNIDCDKANDISLYPNPTSGIVHINGLAANTSVQVYDAQGRVVANQIAGENPALDLSGLSSGIYQIIVTDNKLTQHKLKVVKQ